MPSCKCALTPYDIQSCQTLLKTLTRQCRWQRTSSTSGGKPLLKTFITSKFRAGSLSDAQQSIFQGCFNRCFVEGLPMEFCIPIGGYKKWRLSAFPEADWAELFHLFMMGNLAFRIAEAHPWGVRVSYIWDDVVMLDINVNDYPPEKIRDYNLSLQRLLDDSNDRFSGFNIRFSLKRMSGCYDRDRYLTQFAGFLRQAEAFWKDIRHAETVRYLEERARTHYYQPDGPVDYSTIRRSAQQIWAHSRIFNDPVFNDSQRQIPVLLRNAPPAYLHLRPCYTSQIQFWVGEGVLVRKPGKTYTTIVANPDDGELRQEGTIPTPDFARLGKNFHSIRLFAGRDHGN
jgi:hypothetical protein